MRKFSTSAVLVLSSISAAVLLTGCSGFSANREAADRLEAFKANEYQKAQAQLQSQGQKKQQVVEIMSRPYIGSQQISAPKTSQWPPALRREATVRMMFSENRVDPNTGMVVVPIADFANQIYRTTGIPVQVKPEALTDALGKPVYVSMNPTFSGSLADLFDQISARHRVFANYRDGQLEFFRTATRSFSVAAALGTTDMTFDASTGGGEGSFKGAASTKTTNVFKSSDNLMKSVAQFLSKGVVPIYNDSTGSLTITDSPDVLEKVGVFLDRENKLMTRAMSFEVSVIRYSETNSAASGVNWQAIYNRIEALSGTALAIASPSVAINPNDGSFSITSVPGVDGKSRFDGSAAILKALNETGNAMVVRRTTLATTNRRPVMQASNKQFDYVNETTASTTLAGVALGQKTKTENEGRTIMIVPSLVNDNSAMVDLSISESVKNPFDTNTIGSGASQQTVKLLDKDTDLIRQYIPLSNGETRVITGIGGRTSSGNEATLDRSLSAVFGGSVSGARRDEQYFLMVTMRFIN